MPDPSSRSRSRPARPRWPGSAICFARPGKPILILGGSRWDEDACQSVRRFAERFHLPVATSYRRLPLFDPLHPCYAGDLGLGPNPKLIARIKASDLVILCGGRLGEIPSQGYTLFDIPGPRTRLVHVHPAAEELGRVYQPDLAIQSGPIRFAEALEALEPPDDIAWRGETDAAHAEYLGWTETPTDQPGGVNLGAVFVWLRDNLAGRHHPLQRGGQLCRLDSSLLPVPALCHPYRADLGLDGLWHAVRRRDEAPVIRTGRCSRSTATVIS